MKVLEIAVCCQLGKCLRNHLVACSGSQLRLVKEEFSKDRVGFLVIYDCRVEGTTRLRELGCVGIKASMLILYL